MVITFQELITATKLYTWVTPNSTQNIHFVEKEGKKNEK